MSTKSNKKNRNNQPKMTRKEEKALLKAKKSELTQEERKLQRQIIKKRRKKRRRRILTIELLVLVILAVLVWGMNKLGKIHFTGALEVKTNDLDAKTEEMLSGYTTIALFGVDNRSTGNYESGNSDSIMIASINNDTKEISIVSVMRDSLFDVDGEGKYRKANYAYNHGGPEEAVNMLNRNLDLDIKDYVAVDFKALADAVDAVGGVDIHVDKETADAMMDCWTETEEVVGRNSKIVKADTSTQTLDGVQALCYARTRHTSGNDFRRASRQREVVEQLITKTKKASAGQLNKLIDSMFSEIGTSMSVTDLIGLATGVQSYTLKQQLGFPFNCATKTLPSPLGSIVVPCTLESNVKLLYQQIYGESDYQVSSGVSERSRKIVKISGCTEKDAKDYGYTGLEDISNSDTSTSTEEGTESNSK